jgi:acetolactate synthase-1/2/3 large subunit
MALTGELTVGGTERLTGGQAVVRSLIAHGVDTLFGLPGIQNDWLYNALYDARDSIRVLHSRHEQGTAYIALGYALARGDLAVCSVVPGPGVLNASTALATAYGLSAPVLMLAGQIPSHLIGRGTGMLHEMPDQLGVLRTLTKWAARAETPAEAPLKIAQAIQEIRSGRPRPAAVEIPMDVLAQRVVVGEIGPPLEPYAPVVDEEAVEKAAEMLGRAERPMIFVGGGAMNASAEVRELAETLQAPVVAYRTGRGIMDSRHYLSLTQPAARGLWDAADVVLALGTSLRTQLQGWGPPGDRKVMRVDVDPTVHTTFGRPDLAITARVEDVLPPLLEGVGRHNRRPASREEEMQTVHAEWERRSAVLEPSKVYLRVIREALGEDGIFLDELTQVGFAARICLPVYHPRTFISTGYMGTLGYGFPTGLGVKVAHPNRRVLAVAGDGGFMFGVGELAAAVQHKIGLVTVVFNNNQYGNVHQMQRDLYDGRVIASELRNPDFVKLAESFGAQGLRAASVQELGPTLERAFAYDGPTIVEVPVGDLPSVDQFR